MRVKALCNIFYKGNLYSAGEVFETDEFLKNTEDVFEETKPESSEKPENKSAEKPTTKRR